MDIEKMKKGLQCIVNGSVRCSSCGYSIDKHGHYGCHQECAADVLELLKGLEGKHPVCKACGKEITHVLIDVFNYDGSDSFYSVPLMYDSEHECMIFTTSENWTGYELTDSERKDSICCPHCKKFPFNTDVEIELHHPVEVLMWT